MASARRQEKGNKKYGDRKGRYKTANTRDSTDKL
jgi:hypothetical protein